MLLIYSKNTKTTILETKNISYNVDEIKNTLNENGETQYHITISALQEGDTGSIMINLNILARNKEKLLDFEDLINEGIGCKIIDLRKF